MYQELEITKAKDGTTFDELKAVLKEGSDLIGNEYLVRMNNLRILGDASFVAEIQNSVYLISYYNFETLASRKFLVLVISAAYITVA